jgi:hypothetical protein
MTEGAKKQKIGGGGFAAPTSAFSSNTFAPSLSSSFTNIASLSGDPDSKPGSYERFLIRELSNTSSERLISGSPPPLYPVYVKKEKDTSTINVNSPPSSSSTHTSPNSSPPSSFNNSPDSKKGIKRGKSGINTKNTNGRFSCFSSFFVHFLRRTSPTITQNAGIPRFFFLLRSFLLAVGCLVAWLVGN